MNYTTPWSINEFLFENSTLPKPLRSRHHEADPTDKNI